ncbi:hypothetical protein [Stigmatella erecta]|uniref:Uncharacterized protein n=1 Tax=Stigmatella erecta TaxID=83460 RepID=A0A1I0K806_9BACT|nr:hypothetical protein [Stigmatella erecta]SEU19063.1 hypothetical protein SAMN05443639_109166 [Stigmatella erecta]
MSRCPSLRFTPALVLVLLAAGTGCSSGPTGADSRRFACTDDSECAAGFVCRESECLPEETPGTPDGGTDAGPSDGGEPDGGQDGGPDSGTPDGGDTSLPTRLAFGNSQPPLTVGQCSNAVVVETRTGMDTAAPVETAAVISLSANPTPGVTFYRDAACQTPTTSVTVEAGSSRAAFHVRGTVAQTVNLGVVAQGFSNANQALTFRAAAPTSLVFVTPAQTLPAGGCSLPVELEVRDAYGNPSSFASARTVTLRAPEGSNLAYFTDPACQTAQTEQLFTAGASRTALYVKSRTGGTFTLTASVSQPFASATYRVTVLPVVRTGYCSLSSNNTQKTCPTSQVDASKTMLFFQAISDDNDPNTSSVRCELASKDAITCSRNDDGTEVELQWQTVERPSLQVQHLSAVCRGSVTTIPLKSIVNPERTFLLVSSEQGGTTLGDDDFFTARLTSASQVELAFSMGCNSGWKASVQAVESPDIHVTRGTTGKMTGTQLTVTGLAPVNLASTALLFTHRVSNTDAPVLCDRVLRGELTSPTSITFSRGAGNPACTTASVDAISWERVEFGASAQTQHSLVTMSPSTESDDFAVGPVDLTRSIVFASGQGPSGQAWGENSYAGDDVPGAALGKFELYAPTEFDADRACSEGTVKWSTTVVQFEP